MMAYVGVLGGGGVAVGNSISHASVVFWAELGPGQAQAPPIELHPHKHSYGYISRLCILASAGEALTQT